MNIDSFFYTDSWTFTPTLHFFCGYGIFGDNVVVGGAGFAEYLKAFPLRSDIPSTGRFVGCFPGAYKTIIKTDDMGQELLFLYQGRAGSWAVSNSFWLLLHNLRMRGVTLEFNEVAHGAFTLKEGRHLGEQILSSQTLAEGVTLVPSTNVLEVDHRDSNLSIREHHLYSYLHSYEADADDLLVDHLEEQLGILASLKRGGYDVRADLSGGFDSRLSFGMATRVFNRVKVRSLVDRSEDYRVAREVASYYDAPINEHYRVEAAAPVLTPLSAAAAVDFWELSCGGGYLPIYPIYKVATGYRKQVSIGGDVCYGFSFFRGKARYNGTEEKISSDIETAFCDDSFGSRVADEFRRGVRSTGAPWGTEVNMQLYYASFRSRFHGGRNSYKVHDGTLRFTPLISSKLLAASIKYSEDGFDESHLINNLYAAVDVNLVNFPFVGNTKRVGYEKVSGSPLANVRLTARSYRLFDGSLSEIPDVGKKFGLYSYGVDSRSVRASERTFKEELDGRMAALYEQVSGLVDGSGSVPRLPLLERDVKLSTGAREWAKTYFLYKHHSLMRWL